MTSSEIQMKAPADLSANAWMKEICLQLALLNEKPKPAAQQPIYDRTQQQHQRR